MPLGRQHREIRMETWQVLMCPWTASLPPLCCAHVCTRNSTPKCLGTERTHPGRLIMLETDFTYKYGMLTEALLEHLM